MITVMEVVMGLELGGTERAMQEFALNMNKKKVKVIVGVFKLGGPRTKFIEQAGIPIVKLTKDNIKQVVKKYKIDAVHLHQGKLDWFKGKVPVFKEVVFNTSFFEQADMNLVISKSLAYKIHLEKKFDYAKNGYVLYYPQNIVAWDKHKISDKAREQVRKRWGCSPNDVVLGRLGRAEPSKTDYLLLAATPKIARLKNVKFVFVGLPKLYKWILALYPGLSKKIIYINQTADDKKIAEFYQSIDIFWHTAQRGETFGNVNTEAMIFSKPVITHETQWNKKNWNEVDNAQIEIVDHNKTGLVTKYPQDVVEAVKMFQRHPGKIVEYGKAGRKKVEKLYDARIICKQFENLVINTLSGKKVTMDVSKQELDRHFANFSKLRNKRIKATSSSQKQWYEFTKAIYNKVEWCYLVMRYLLREKLNITIEK